MHFHAYSYRGSGEAIKSFDSGARSPGGPDFASSVVPPEATNAWLAKPTRMLRGTFDDPAGAVEWLRAQHAEVEPSIWHKELNTQAPSVDTMAETAADTLARGNDVVWAWWLIGGNFVDLTVVCCPNRDGDHRCPQGRTDRRPAGVSAHV